MKDTGERGAIMVEATWCVLLVLFVCLFFIGYGLMLYQHTVQKIVANDIAEEVSQIYKLRMSEGRGIGDVSENDAASVGKYRFLIFESQFTSAGNRKAKELMQDRLKQTTLAKMKPNMQITVERVPDDVGRYHFKVTVKQKYDFLFGDLLKWLGQDENRAVETTVYAAGTDITFYANMIHNTKYLADLGDKVMGEVFGKMISFVGTLGNLGC